MKNKEGEELTHVTFYIPKKDLVAYKKALKGLPSGKRSVSKELREFIQNRTKVLEEVREMLEDTEYIVK